MRIKSRQYEVDGQKRYTTEIQVQEMTFLSTKKDPNAQKVTSPENKTSMPHVNSDEENDLPF